MKQRGGRGVTGRKKSYDPLPDLLDGVWEISSGNSMS